MEIKRLQRKIRLDSRKTAIRYQLITELVFLRNISLIETDLTCLVFLVEWGSMPLKDFCHKVVVTLYGDSISTDVNKHPVRVQGVRNRLGMLEKRGLIVKTKVDGKRMIALNPVFQIESQGNILLDYNFIYVEAKESEGSASRVSGKVAAL
jgi:hypothetical protein